METTEATMSHNHEHDYSDLLKSVKTSFDLVALNVGAVFKTDAEGLFELYLDSLPGERQVHNCNCCKRFIETYGGLVFIDDGGAKWAAMWSEAVPGFYQEAFQKMATRVEKARVTGIFLTKEKVWGTPKTGDWSHLSVIPPAHLVYRERALTAGQAMAAAKENFRTVSTALGEFKPKVLDEALRVLKADAVARAERFVGPVQWLRDLHDRPKGRPGENLLWRAIAAAPEGYCHPRAAVTGSLLEDIAAGLPFDDIARKFASKVHPLQYQRPQVAPSAGNVAAAEALFAKLGLEPALHRRYARLEDLTLLWKPEVASEEALKKGIFGHLKTKDADEVPSLSLPVQTVTWDKFSRGILPLAQEIKLLVPAHGNFIALTTAENPDAPPILSWDHEEERNPLAWYVYNGGSTAARWSLQANALVTVTGITAFPNAYGSKPMPFLSEGAILVLEGAIDTDNQSSAIFPECLKAELHGVRSTIEAYSRSTRLSGREEASACGYDLRKSFASCRLRVKASGAWADYHVDRWD